MMTDLTAAAKRVSAARAAIKYQLKCPWEAEPYTSIGMGATRYIADLEIVADAYALEHDDTPLTVELLTSMGYVQRWDGWWTHGPLVDLVPRDDGSYLFSRCGTSLRMDCRTLGQLGTAMRLAVVQATNTETT